jgi:hypothetical protein
MDKDEQPSSPHSQGLLRSSDSTNRPKGSSNSDNPSFFPFKTKLKLFEKLNNLKYAEN